MTEAAALPLAGPGAETRAADARLARSTAVITAWNTASRLTGFVRVMAVAAALGATFLGNTYQSANLVSNILFDLLAAGLLAAPLVPAFVELHDVDLGDEAERLAGTLLSLAVLALGSVTIVTVAAARPVMRLLTTGVADPGVRGQEVALGAFLLWFFVPQLLLYAVGAVATALLNARRRFAAAAAAPVANNVVVVATMACFLALRRRYGVGLGLAMPLKLLLAVGTTGGVLAMTAVPLLALRRSGLRLRPRWQLSDPRLRQVGRVGAWGAAYLATSQMLLAVTLVLANRVAGGVVAYQVAWTFVLLPHALLAHPMFTALYPRLAAHAHRGDWDRFGRDVAAGTRTTAAVILPASALLVALGGPALRLVRAGQLNLSGAGLVGRVLAAYAAGLVGYSVLLLLVRAATAAGQARLAAAVGAAVGGVGVVLMLAGSSAAHGGDRVVVLGAANSIVMLGGAASLYALLRRRTAVATPPILAGIARSAATAVAGGAAGAAVVAAIGEGAGRGHSLVALVAGGTAAVAAMLATLLVLRAPELRRRSVRDLFDLP